MTTFANAILNAKTTTENGMRARVSSGAACVDLFFKIGAMRNQDPIPAFVAAYAEDRETALRIAQYARDIRGGMGERKIYRAILNWLSVNDAEAANALASKTPLIGRWDDIFEFIKNPKMHDHITSMIRNGLEVEDGLLAKWLPREGKNRPLAGIIRSSLKMTPKQYRKTLVRLSTVVESDMCAKNWDGINFSHVPSVAASRYRTAFWRNTPKFAEYVEQLKQQKLNPVLEGSIVKVNASAIFPHDVIKGKFSTYGAAPLSATDLDFMTAQWDALPNYVGDASILPLVDVSGSMGISAGGTKTTCLDVAVSLGLYLADKNVGKFKDTFLTFSAEPQLLHLKGNIVQKLDQMVRSKWNMNTNLEAALVKILATAIAGDVPQSEMPKVLLILSDMQFDQCIRPNDSAIKMIKDKYKAAGYTYPAVVFWNLRDAGNTPVKYNKIGTALVSGFSPAILKSVLSADLDDFTPESVMWGAIGNPRYDI